MSNLSKRLNQLMMLGATLLLATAPPSLAQPSPGSNGRALDGNLQVGSGGINASQRRMDFRINNARVTGNITGPSFFQGTVGYRAPGEFLGVTGSDELFRFRAETVPSSVPIITARSFGARQAPLLVLRPSSGVTGRDVRLGGRTIQTQLRAQALRGQLYDRGTFTGIPGQVLTQPQHRPAGVVRQEDGEALNLRLSPLRGVFTQQSQPHRRNYRVLPDEEDKNDKRLLGPPKSQDDEEATEEEQDLPFSTILPPSPFNQNLAGAPESPAQATGRVLTKLIEDDADQQKVDNRVDQVERAIFGRLDRAVRKPGQDAYLDLLAEMREAAGVSTDPEASSGITLADPTATAQASAEAQRLQALRRRARGLPEQDEPDDPDTEQTDPDQQKDQANESIEKLIATLKASLPARKTLAGDTESEVNKTMRQAELDLNAGRYFRAEQRYQRVLRLRPGYPLARIGLVHSQLGAGLMRSAAYNLRNVFSAHPELISTRYEAHVLPSQERLDWVREQLDTMVSRTTTRSEPGILIAYLGHQASNQSLVLYGLDLAQARDPDDMLIPLLRRIWIDQKNSKGEQPKAHEAAKEAEPKADAKPQVETVKPGEADTK